MGKLKYPLGILLTIIIGILLTIWLCCGNCYTGDCDDGNTITTQEEVNKALPEPIVESTESSWKLNTSNGALITASDQNLNFNLNGFKHLTPVSESLDQSFGDIKSFLDSNTDQKLLIIGFYKSSEENTSAFSNLGEARANDVKNHLTSLGLDAAKIDISGTINNDILETEGILKGPLAYDLKMIPQGNEAAEAEKALDDLATQIKEDPLVLYFATGSDAVQLTAQQRKKVSDMNKYIGARPDAVILVSGHSDNEGNRASNIKLSKNRADTVKAYLEGNGIPSAKIETVGKGPDAPIATNATAAGKAKNRRVEVTLK